MKRLLNRRPACDHCGSSGRAANGTVTLLFSDVDGSTELVKRLGERYGDALAEHRRLLRGGFTEHGGIEIDTQGDAFFIAFGSARDAVAAAVSAQRALATYSWRDGVEVRSGWVSTPASLIGPARAMLALVSTARRESLHHRARGPSAALALDGRNLRR